MFSKREALSIGWQTFKGRWKLLIGVTLFSAVTNFSPGVFQTVGQDTNSSVAIVFLIVMWIFQILLSLGVLRIAITLIDKKNATFGDLFSQHRHILHYLFGSILYGLIVAVGLVLFIVPGIIFAVRMQLWPYAMVDKHIGPVASLKASWRMTKGHVINLFLFNVLVVLVTILGAILLGLGLLVATPVTMLATAWVYRKLAS